MELSFRRVVECLHSPFCRSLKVFYFQARNWSLNRQPAAMSGIERSVMPIIVLVLSVVFSALIPGAHAQTPYANSVVEYSSGTGFTPGYDDPTSALGEPSRATPGMFPGPVDPFNPPYLPSQIVSIGNAGFITLQLDTSIFNESANPFGIDFVIFGNNGFTITNGDFGGGGITDGSTFTFDPPGTSRVLVSSDGIIYYELVPPSNIDAVVDGLFPTDGSGNFQTPVDPTLTRDDFAGAGLPEIRALYAGAAGGTGFDLAWAQNDLGNPANLTDARFVRIESLAGKIEIDGLAVVPEPATWMLSVLGGVLLWAIRAGRGTR